MPLRESGANSSTSSIDCPDLQSQLVLLCQKLKMLSGSGSQVLLSLQLPELLTFAHFHLSLIISFTLPDLADARWQKPHSLTHPPFLSLLFQMLHPNTLCYLDSLSTPSFVLVSS